MNESPVQLCKLSKFRPKSDTTDVLNVHYTFDTSQPSEYVAIFQKLAPSTVKITVLTSALALERIPSLTFRIQGGPRYTLPTGTSYPYILHYPDTFLILPVIPPTCIIPRTIIQIWPEEIVSQSMGFATDAWMKLNPEYNYITFDSRSAHQFITTHFNKYVVRAYESLERDDCRSHVFRYCYLYLHGGVFVDAVTVPQVPLYAYMPKDTVFTLTDSVLPHGINTTFIATQKQNPIIEYVIRNIIWNICTKQQTYISQQLVKDAIFGRSLNIYFGREPNTPNPLQEFKSGHRRLYSSLNNSIVDKMQRTILYNSYINPDINTIFYPTIPSSSANDESAEDLLVIGKLPLLSHPA